MMSQLEMPTNPIIDQSQVMEKANNLPADAAKIFTSKLFRTRFEPHINRKQYKQQ